MSSRDSAPEQSAWLLQQVQQGDEAAAEAIFERYAERLTRLARSRLSAKLAARLDPDDILMSAYRSFFVAAREGRFSHQRGGDLWRLLVEVTLHKLYRHVEHHRAQRRSIEREERGSAGGAALQGFAGREPTPAEALAAAEELEAVLKQLSERGGQAVELRLQGYEQEEIAAQLGCTERTVRRWLADARRILAARGGSGFVPSAARQPPPQPPTHAAAPREVPIDAPLAWSDYVLQEQIGAGASGKVYRALHRSTNNQCAVKFLRKALLNEPGTIVRFAREAATVAALHHPGIVAIHGLGRSPGGGYFLVMDLIEGADLDRVTRERRLEARQAAALVADAARIVHFANEQGVIHCDLKPGNLLLTADSQVRVTDFGLAVGIASGAAGHAALAGTPAFMAPEQVDAGWGAISPRTDVWGLGAVLYFLVFAIPPHAGRGPSEVLSRAASGKPVEFPVAQVASVPEAILDILSRCLAKRPEDRFASCAALAAALSPVWRHNA